MRARMVELIALEIDFGAVSELCEPLSEIKRAGAANIMGEEIIKLGKELRIGLSLFIGFFKL